MSKWLRRVAFKWARLRLPLAFVALLILVNVAYHQTSTSSPSSRGLERRSRSFFSPAVHTNDAATSRRARLDERLKTHADQQRDDSDVATAEVAGSPEVMPTIDNVRLTEGSTEGGMSLRAEGPPDPQDTELLLQIVPVSSRSSSGAKSDFTLLIELHPAETSRQRTRHIRRQANQLLSRNASPEATPSNMQRVVKALSASKERLDRRYRFVLIVVAVRTRKHLDVYPTIQEWQQHCDSIDAVTTPTRGEHGDGARPTIVCLFVLAFPNDFGKRSVAHYASLFDDDDSVLVLHTDVSLSRGGLVKLQESGFEQGTKHFTSALGVKAEIDYVLLTSIQFAPASQRPGSMFVADLVKQFEDSSDVVDLLARRSAGGATRSGPILGCTTVLDEIISSHGPASEYRGAQIVMDHGVDFLFGNGGAGAVLNSMYAVRRHAGLLTSDDRVHGLLPPTAQAVLVPSQAAVNASALPAGLESVHGVSPHCALISERVYRNLLDHQRKMGGGVAVDGDRGATQDTDSDGVPEVTTMHSALEEFEDTVGTGNHRSSASSPQANRSGIARFIQVDPDFEPHVVGYDAAASKTVILDLVHVRLIRLDKTRSGIRFADVMSATPRYKRLVSYFIRFLDESIRFFDSIAPDSFFNMPKDREYILKRLPKKFRAVEAAHDEVMRQISASKENVVAAGILFASRSLDALTRWYQRDRAQQAQQFHNHNTQISEESLFWSLCLTARKLQVPSLISNMTVRLLQHEYLEGAILSPAVGVGSLRAASVRPSSLLSTSAVSLRTSPIYKAFTAGVVLPVSTRLGGPHQQHWETALRKLNMHPSFHQKPKLQVVWYTHCCHCCGFSNELQSLVYPLQHYVNVHLTAGPECFCDNASRSLYDTFERLHSHPQNIKRYETNDVMVYISHTNPTLYHLHRELNADAQHDYLVGRSMYEFSRINAEHIEIANRMADEVWVPAQFVYHSYLSSGAQRDKLVIVPEAIDTHTFSPISAGRMSMPPQDLFHMCNRKVTTEDVQLSYTFLSDFKWEPRKGWDVLFEAYFRAFTASDHVVLFVMTHIWFSGGPETYGWANNITWIMEDLELFMRTKTGLYNDPRITKETLPTFCIISQSLAVTEIAALYNSVDAFAYTTRGEGWGLPAMQAMSMGLPVMATNFGGVTEFLKPFNSFLVQLDGVVEIPLDSVYGWSFGTKWAEPSVAAAVNVMRYLSTHRDHGRRVGAVARQYIVDNFSEEALGVILNGHLQRIREKVLARRVENEMRQQLSP